MKTKSSLFIYGLVTLSLVLSACIGLPAFPSDEEQVSVPLGPQITAQEHQTQVFEALWTDIKENYIYYQSANINWDALHKKYIDRIDGQLTSDEFITLMKSLEKDLPQNEFVFESRQERIDGDIADTSTYGGIGAFVGFEEKDSPHIVILDVMPGSPAEKAGLKAHDSILAIDGSPVLLEEGLDAVKRVRGEAGTDVTLTISTPGEEKRDVKVIRGQLTSGSDLKTQELSDSNIGYILLPTSASASTTNDVLSILTDFSLNKDLKGLILDLRISNATSNWPLQSMLSLFTDGDVGQIYNHTQSQELQVTGEDVHGSQQIPLVILVGENTSGLAEVFAAAMQASGRAKVIGSNTSGNIETLNGYLLPDGSQIFIADTSFRFVGGSEIGRNGIKPDVEVDASWDQITASQDPVIDAALQSFEVVP